MEADEAATRDLPLDRLPPDPTDSGRGHEKNEGYNCQPHQALEDEPDHSNDQPNRQQNNHESSHAQSIRLTSDEWNICPEAIEAAASMKKAGRMTRPTSSKLLVQRVAPHPTNRSRTHKQDSSNNGQPQQSLDHKTKDREDQPDDKKNRNYLNHRTNLLPQPR